MSRAEDPDARDEGASREQLFIRAIEWKIAWRHLRVGGETPQWANLLLLASLYLCMAGLGFALHAATGIQVGEGAQVFSGTELSPSQRWFGIFGAVGVFAGVLGLVFALLGRFFNLLATIITMSVLLGCMALVVVLSLMTGLEEDLRDKILNQKAHVLVSAEDGNRFADYGGLVEAIAATPGVAGASPYVEGEVMAKSGMNRQGAVLLGVIPDQLTQVSNIEDIVKRGHYRSLSDPTLVEAESPLADDGTPWRLRHLEGRQSEASEGNTVASPWTLGIPLAVLLIASGMAMRRENWKIWVPPALAIFLVAGGISLSAPPASEGEEGRVVDLPELEGSAPDPMLDRLKPKRSREDEALEAKKTKKSKKGKKVESSGAPKGGKTLPTSAAGKAALEAAIDPPIELGPRVGADSIDEGARKGGDPESPDEATKAGLLRALAPKGLPRDPKAVVRSAGVAPAIDSALIRRAGASPPEQEAEDDGGWEDPVEELGLELEPEPPPASTGGGADAPGAAAATKAPARESEGVPDAVLVGNELAMELAVRVGSRVQLITPIGRMTPAGRVPGLLATRVGGVFYSGNYEYDRKNIYAPLAVVQAFLRSGDRVSGIEVKLDDVDAIVSGKKAVEDALRAAGRDSELRVETWQELNKNLFSAMLLEKIAMGVALLFVVLVASFGILASNLMSVLEKAKEIAILKAMGSSDVQIQRVFVAEGLSVGLLGAMGGLGVGLGVCWALSTFGFPFDENVYYIEHLPVVVNPAEVAVVGLAAMGIIFLSSLYPARVASRMRPVDGLRESEG
jgi:lipoprotein-releasing system permease protein